MLPTRRPSRLVVQFDGFHQSIPSLSVGALGMSDERFRELVRRHVRRYLHAKHDDILVEASLDVRGGSVRVRIPGDDEGGLAGWLTINPETEGNTGERRVGVNPLIVIGVVVFLALILFF